MIQDPTEIDTQNTSDIGLVGKFLIAPSPVTSKTTSYFCYRLGADKDVRIYIYNRRGRIISTIDIESGSPNGGAAGYMRVPFNLTLPTGLYFAFLDIDGAITRTKFEVQQ